MSTNGLHEHARRKGCSWVTQEVTDGLAAWVDTITRIGIEPTAAFVLGHPGDRRHPACRGGYRAREPGWTVRFDSSANSPTDTSVGPSSSSNQSAAAQQR